MPFTGLREQPSGPTLDREESVGPSPENYTDILREAEELLPREQPPYLPQPWRGCSVMPNTLYYGDNLQVMRQHIPDESVDLVYLDPPDCLEVSAWTDKDIIMGLRHKEYPVRRPVPPESIVTVVGKDVLRNFLDSVDAQEA